MDDRRSGKDRLPAHGRIDGDGDIRAGLAALVAGDPALAPVIARAGPVPLRRRPPGLEGLASIIVAQMVSRASAEAIWTRLVEETGGRVEAGTLAALTEAQCRSVGLSRAKERALKAAASAVGEGRLDLHAIARQPPEAAVGALCALPGVGRWTGEVYLVFCAGHPDIFPAGDLALRLAVAHAFGLAERPAERQISERAVPWRPWRSVAARLFWAYYAAVFRRQAIPVAAGA